MIFCLILLYLPPGPLQAIESFVLCPMGFR